MSPRRPCKNWYENWYLRFYKIYHQQILQAGTSAGFDSNETNQPGVRDVITSSLSDKLKTYLQYQCRQISQDGNLPWCTPADYVTWQFDHADLYDRLTYYNHYISSITVPMVPKLGKIVT